jgi:hypothetical protein
MSQTATVRVTVASCFGRFFSTALVLAAVVYLNVWPRVTQLLSSADRAGWAIVAFQCLCLFLLSQIPFAWRSRGWGARIPIAILVAALFTASLSFSIESIGLVRDAARDHNREVIANIATWTTQRDDATAEPKSLPNFVPTTDAQIAAAKQAAEDARKDKEHECSDPIGFECRPRMDKAAAKEADLDRLQTNMATQRRAHDV